MLRLLKTMVRVVVGILVLPLIIGITMFAVAFSMFGGVGVGGLSAIVGWTNFVFGRGRSA
jgi:hypothetical protein